MRPPLGETLPSIPPARLNKFSAFRSARHSDSLAVHNNRLAGGAVESLRQSLEKLNQPDRREPLQDATDADQPQSSHAVLDQTQLVHFISASETRSP